MKLDLPSSLETIDGRVLDDCANLQKIISAKDS